MVHSHNFYELYQQTFKKYTELYGKQVCVFLQKGSFYEFYGQQDPKTLQHINTGKEIIDFLGVVLHTYPNDGPGGTIGYYGGVPTSHLDKWAGKLTQAGWTVVVIDEVKNGSGAVSKREVSQVLSAGTHVASAENARAFILAALWLKERVATQGQPLEFGVAAADLTTGQVYLYEGVATGTVHAWHTDDLRHFFQVHPPKELVLHIPVALSDIQHDLEGLRRTLHIPSAPIHIRVREQAPQSNALDLPTTREDYMRQMFQPRTALPLRTWLRLQTDGSSLQERAIVALLRFAEDHAPKLASCLQAPNVWHPTHNLQIINNALTQLNMIGSTPDQQCVEQLFVSPQTAMGKRSLTMRLCSPVANAEAIRARQEEVSWILDAPKNQQKEIEAALSLMYDIARLHRTIVRGTIQAADVLQLFQSYKSAEHLWSTLKNSPFVAAADMQQKIQQCLAEFTVLFDTEKAARAQETPDEVGFLQNSVGPKTAVAENRVAEIYSKANTWLKTLTEFTKIKADSVSYKPTEKNMFCIHTTKTVQKAVETFIKNAVTDPDYQKRDYSKLTYKTLTSAARIEHPALEKFQEELDSAKSLLARMMSAEVPAACIQYLTQTRECWQPIEDWVINVDLALTMAKTSQQQGWVKPTILNTTDSTEPSHVEIENLRHPLIEVQKRQSKYVTHNISLGGNDQGQGWLLYGMNASGKSSLMKAIGLAVLLAQVGSYVPATAMVLRPFHRLATRILNQDNLWAGLSSFAVEMSELREILQVADHQTLVLGDELCAGTESISGTAIVAAGIQHLHKAGSRFVLATHLHDLMKLKEVTELPALCVFHLHVEYDKVRDILIYHRTIRPGPGSSMYGLEVAKALHLPTDMIEAAFQMRRKLLGEAAIEDATKSAWNSEHVRRMCSICGERVVRDLEVHHLEERAAAQGQRNQDGTALNHVRNLATLCQTCHDKHHAGTLIVGPVEDTSAGPIRQITDLSQYKFVGKEEAEKAVKSKRPGFSEEEITAIQKTVRERSGLSSKLLVFQIQRDHGIQISEAQLKTLQKKGIL
jgi:DNA mismatch repair protein MutS